MEKSSIHFTVHSSSDVARNVDIIVRDVRVEYIFAPTSKCKIWVSGIIAQQLES